MPEIRSALSLGMRPTAHILRLKKPKSGWTNWDHLFALAYQQMQDETCPQCGHPIWICRSNNNDLQFRIQSDVCQVSAAKEKEEERRKNGKDKEKRGEILYAEPYMLFDGEMPTREDYYKEIEEQDRLNHPEKYSDRIE